MRSCDKYGFKSLGVGETKMVFGVQCKHAQMTYYRYCVRHSEMIHRDFVWRPIRGGIVIERVR